MGLEQQFYQLSNGLNFPVSYLLIGPIVLAIALHIVRSHSGKAKVYKSGHWQGVKASGNVSTTASLLSLIFIVVFCGFAFNPKAASAFGVAVHNKIALSAG